MAMYIDRTWQSQGGCHQIVIIHVSYVACRAEPEAILFQVKFLAGLTLLGLRPAVTAHP